MNNEVGHMQDAADIAAIKQEESNFYFLAVLLVQLKLIMAVCIRYRRCLIGRYATCASDTFGMKSALPLHA